MNNLKRLQFNYSFRLISSESVYLTIYLQNKEEKSKWYYTNQIICINIVRNEVISLNLFFWELIINCSFPSISLHPRFAFNPSYPGAGPPPPQRLGLQDNGKFGVAWVIYRIQMQTQINPLGFKIELKSLTVG